MSLLLVLQSVLWSVTGATTELPRLPVTRYQSDPLELALRGVDRATTFDFFDNNYLTTIEVGDNGEKFRVVLDTGSSYFFIPSVSCGSKCGVHKKYSCPKPSADVIYLNYGTGEATGNICTDTITVAGLKLRNQEFVVVNSEDNVLRSFNFDGILGLAYTTAASIKPSDGGMRYRYITPVFYNLVNQKKLKKLFSFYMTSLDNGGRSFVYLGGSDPNFYEGDMKRIPVVTAYVENGYPYYKHWQVKMTRADASTDWQQTENLQSFIPS